MSDAIQALWIPALIVVGLVICAWYVCTHECAREHTEQRMSCSTIRTWPVA